MSLLWHPNRFCGASLSISKFIFIIQATASVLIFRVDVCIGGGYSELPFSRWNAAKMGTNADFFKLKLWYTGIFLGVNVNSVRNGMGLGMKIHTAGNGNGKSITGVGGNGIPKAFPTDLCFRVGLLSWPCHQQLGFDLPRQQWSLLNRFRTVQGHCGACRRKWRLTDIDLCPCGETQTMSHIVESCPLTKLNGGWSRLHSADEDAVSWLTNYG